MTTPPDARIPMLDVDAAHAAAAGVGVPEGMARLSVFKVLLRHEDLAARVNGLLHQLLWNGSLEPRRRELIIMRIGWRQGSVYEWTQHWRVARMLEIPEDDLLGVRDWKASDRFDRADRAVLAATDETLGGGAISARTWAELEATVPDEKARLEVVLAIANWSMFAQLLRTLEVPLEDGVDPWPPDGAVPEPARNPVASELD
ncbi:carboxymuconolactone decarboxylase family protein [Iamia sp. SCSIO 61187]|uniref:carboxymuconolactone decarboxylase family protein n=1 Tax=Iamia sp. SCSIO 61187 TaxID=2722752 RepID=UPI001C62DFE1|nr:carboxymuconolactone decarboxylase family protein [Iamia sp. SCSIO 61187]QYG94450.1 carboxymuconolactone decarboxylase family protein [Iamia sp. SCSIO 61187]